MASLTETAYYTRKTIKLGAVGIVALILARLVMGAAVSWWKRAHPPPPPPPTVGFGLLPPPNLPAGMPRGSLELRLETIDGGTPDLGDQAAVYFMPAFRANVLGLELAEDLASRMGFLFAPTPRTEEEYVWTRQGELPGTLTVNLTTGHFTLDTSWADLPELTQAAALPEPQAISAAQSYLRSLSLLPADLSVGTAKTEFLKFTPEGAVPAASQSEANIVAIHFFRSDLEDRPVYSEDPNRGIVQVLISNSRLTTQQVISVDYRYSPVERDRSETYPLRSASEAWEELRAGGGVIANREGTEVAIAVRKIELGYVDSQKPQDFLEPIYIFTGDAGLVAYFPAVSAAWLGTTDSSQ